MSAPRRRPYRAGRPCPASARGRRPRWPAPPSATPTPCPSATTTSRTWCPAPWPASARGTDERMLELLEPYAGQRGRVLRLLLADGLGAASASAPPADPADRAAGERAARARGGPRPGGAANGEATCRRPRPRSVRRRFTPWQRSLLHGGVAYLLSRLHGAWPPPAWWPPRKTPQAGVSARSRSSTSSRRGTASGTSTSSATATRSTVPPNVTYFDSSRPAPPSSPPTRCWCGRPTGSCPAATYCAGLPSTSCSASLVVLAVGLLARRLYGDRVAGRSDGARRPVPRQLRAVVQPTARR